MYTFYLITQHYPYFRLLNGFRSNSAAHKEMLAILAAITDVIKENGGKETSTEYYLALVFICFINIKRVCLIIKILDGNH